MTLFQQTAAISASQAGEAGREGGAAGPAQLPLSSLEEGGAPASGPLQVSVNQHLRKSASIFTSAGWRRFLPT